MKKGRHPELGFAALNILMVKRNSPNEVNETPLGYISASADLKIQYPKLGEFVICHLLNA